MSLRDLIFSLAEKKILLREDNGGIRYQAPAGTMDDATKSSIKTYRDAILNLIRPYSPRWSLAAPASVNQESLVFIQKLASPASAYHVALSFRCRNAINRTAFLSACSILVRKHSQLRASFRSVHDAGQNDTFLCQIISDLENIPVHFDESEYSDTQLRSVLMNSYRLEFDIENGPLVRWTVFNASSDSPVVLMTMHHAITDAWSIRILFRELLALYRSMLSDASMSTDNDIGYSYIDFTIDQHKFLKSETFSKQMDAYGNVLRPSLIPLSLKSDFQRESFTDLRGSTLPFTIPAETYNAMVSLAKRHDVSISALLFTSYALFLSEESGQTHFIAGMPCANRTNPLFSNATGYFVNTVAIPVAVTSGTTHHELLKTINAALSRSADFQHIPFPALVAHLNPSRTMTHSPVFQVLFNYMSRSLTGNAGDFLYDGNPEETRTVEGIDIQPFPIQQQEGQYDLTLEIIERSGYLTGHLKFSTALFSLSTGQRLLRSYIEILNRLINNPLRTIDTSNKPGESGRKRLAIAATFTADLIAESLDFWINRLGLHYEPVFTPYGQILQQLLEPSSAFNTNSDGCNVMLLRLDDMRYTSTGSSSLTDIFSARCDELLATLTTATTATKAVFLIFFCPSAPDLMAEPEIHASINEIQTRYTALFNNLPGVYATSTDTLLSWYPVPHYHDQLRLENGHIPYTDEFLTVIGTAIIRRLFVLQQKPVKVISVDCDNTLWSGVAAEDGAQQVVVTDYHRTFQRMLMNQRDAGRLLTLVSKNRENDVHAVFNENRSMEIQLVSVFSRRINWEPKSENIRSLADQINVGLESFLFIDDNPAECAQMCTALPQVLTVQFPPVPSDIPAFISSLWMLDTPKATSEDTRRAEYYQMEKLRNIIRSYSRSFSEFLAQLELEVTFEELNEQNGERLSQLTWRTNQFNFSDTRWSYQELLQLQHKGYDIFAVKVKDRFGDYGIVGMTACRTENTMVIAEIFLLSCRVLGRGVEYQMLNQLVRGAQKKHASSLRLHFKVTDRNRPAMDFIEKILKQHPQARLENGCIFEPLSEVPAFSPVTADHEQDVPQLSIKAESPEPDKMTDELMLRNQRYYDIVQNLSSLDDIRKAVAQYQEQKHPHPVNCVNTTPSGSLLESKIAGIWKKTLRTSTISTTTNFFDHGGTSLLLPQVLSDLEKETGVRMSLVDLFKYTTVEKLAAYIDEKSAHNSSDTVSASTIAHRRLSGAQMMRVRQQQSRSRLNK